MGPGEFEEKLRTLNKDFRIKKVHEPDYSDPANPTVKHKIEILCKDGMGQKYVVGVIENRAPNMADFEHYRVGELRRKKMEHQQMLQEWMNQRKAAEEAKKRKRVNEHREMAKDACKLVADVARYA